MVSLPPESRSWRAFVTRKRAIRAALVLVALIILAPVIANALDIKNLDAFANAGENPRAAYWTVTLLVFGDGVFPLLPGETTVTTAAVIAAGGELQIWWVCVAASLGAVLGDSTVYWVARLARGRVRRKMESMAANPKARDVLAVFDDRAPLLIVVGRYVPGFRFVVNFTMGGVIRMPYRRFLPWSLLSGVLWGFYTGLLAYSVATVLSGRPLVSLFISGTITTIAITWVLVAMRRDYRRTKGLTV